MNPKEMTYRRSIFENFHSITYKNVEKLKIRGRVKSFDGLEDFKNLTHLDMSFCNLTSLKGFPELTNLQVLKLNKNSLRSLNHLHSNLRLSRLEASHNFIRKFESMYRPSLREIDLSHNKIHTINIEKCRNVKKLNVESNEIKNIKFGECITELTISNNKLSDLSILPIAPNLIKLDISNNHIKNIEYLSNFPKLSVINFSNNLVTFLPKEMNQYHSINGSDNKIEKVDITLIEGYVDLSKNPMKMCRIKGCRHVPEINLSLCELEVVQLDGEIHQCKLSYNKITKLSDVIIPKCTRLEMDHNEISDVRCGKNLQKVSHLYLDYNKIKNLDGFTLPNIRYLSLQKNQIIYLRMKNLETLEYLNLNDNFIEDFMDFPDLENLKTLLVQRNAFVNFTGIPEFPSLRFLSVQGNLFETFAGINDHILTIVLQHNEYTSLLKSDFEFQLIDKLDEKKNVSYFVKDPIQHARTIIDEETSDEEVELSTKYFLSRPDRITNAVLSILEKNDDSNGRDRIIDQIKKKYQKRTQISDVFL